MTGVALLRPFQVHEYRGKWWYLCSSGIAAIGPFKTQAEAIAAAAVARKEVDDEP